MLVAHPSDSVGAEALTTGKFQVYCANILMDTLEEKTQVARTTLSLACPGIVTASSAETQ
jgi:hypothetical protein